MVTVPHLLAWYNKYISIIHLINRRNTSLLGDKEEIVFESNDKYKIIRIADTEKAVSSKELGFNGKIDIVALVE